VSKINPAPEPASASPSSIDGGQAPPWATDGGASQPANLGAWQDSNGNWVWAPGAAPDPNLESQYGSETITDPTRNPNGQVNTGAWLQSGRTWVWMWGATASASLSSQFGSAAMTNPDATPTGGPVSTPPGAPPASDPPPPDAAAPSVSESWGSNPPDLTGNVPPPSGSGNTPSAPGTTGTAADGSQNIDGASGAAPEAPPYHPPFTVSPGAIRDAEITVDSATDANIALLNNLESVVSAAKGSNLATDASVLEQFVNTADNLIAAHGQVIKAMGGFTQQLNQAGQNYSYADMQSVLPQT
jgi:hypothetical protein